MTREVGTGMNTSGDQYQNLNNTHNVGRKSSGFIQKSNWVNAFAKASYDYKKQAFINAVALLDVSSNYGVEENKAKVFPAVEAGFNFANMNFLQGNKTVTGLKLRGEYAVVPNSRFSNLYGRNYYKLNLFNDVSGVRREQIPNYQIAPEKVHNTEIGVDLGFLNDRISASVDLFSEKTKDMIVKDQLPSIYGFSDFYDNTGEMETNGFEVSLHARVINNAQFKVSVGGNMTWMESEVKKLGKNNNISISKTNDVSLTYNVGGAANTFFGHQSFGVFTSKHDANQAALFRNTGQQFGAGDIHFMDKNDNHIIEDIDRTSIGSSLPDFFGGVYAQIEWKKFSVFANFNYSVGNEVYNGLRRVYEGGDVFGNQALSIKNRWQREGDVTTIPKVSYLDPAGNNRFSSRWIEDGSFVRLKELTVNYELPRSFLFFTGGNVFVSGENLFTWSNYLGLDPELAYGNNVSMLGMDLGQVPNTRRVRLGLTLNF